MATDNIRTSGGIFTHHFIDSLLQDTLSHPAVRPESFTMPGRERVTETVFERMVANAWEALVERWDKVEREFGSYDLSALRLQWLRPLFYHLNIEPEYQRGDTVLEGDLRFPISHLGRAGTTEYTIPIHSVLYDREVKEDTLETRVGSGRGIKTLAPHDMVQRYLNLSKEHDWAIVADGVYLRLLRDFHHTYTRGYVEFSLQDIFSSRDYAGFRAMYRLLHASRFVVPSGEEQEPIEELYEDSLAMGVKVGEDLRKNVQEAIESLANGFLTSSTGFLEQVRRQEEGAARLYRDILTTIYRVLFLLFAEQRGMLPGRGSLYMEEFSLTALRTLAEQPFGEDRSIDLWEKLKTTITMVEHGVDDLDIYPYNGALFSLERTPLLTPEDPALAPTCRNDHLLVTIKHLTTVEKEKVLQRISYADLSVEEIGSIYESLLEFTPRISETYQEVEGRQIQVNTFFLDPRGSGRKTTGSYYTPPALVNELIKSALVPVMEDRLRAVVPGYDSEMVEALNEEEQGAAEVALLEIKVVDPAAGSGAFLIAANNKLGLELARIRTGEIFPAEREIQRARRDVLAHCIYAVDLNPMAVELCKVSLWINAAVADAPLNFLDHHIKCGNSLVGATPALIAEGVPDGAYKPVTGDDKEFVKEIKAQNNAERKGQMTLVRVTPMDTKEDLQKWSEIDRLAEISPNIAEAEYQAYWGSKEYWDKRLPYDLWMAAFFAQLINGNPVPSTQDVKQANISSAGLSNQIVKDAQNLAQKYRFFHWHLEFPQIFDEMGKGGFDVVLGNPPWDQIQFDDKEFFGLLAPEIAQASNTAERKRKIDALVTENNQLYKEYIQSKFESDKTKNFYHSSNKFSYTNFGRLNLAPLFSELSVNLIQPKGRSGEIIPTAIATGSFLQYYFNFLIDSKRLISLYDFENKKGLFPDVHRSFKFCLLTLGGSDSKSGTGQFAFFCFDVDDLRDKKKIFTLCAKDFDLINPNTRTCPIFRSRIDAELTRKLYKAAPILDNENTDENPWGISFKLMFMMNTDSNIFKTRDELEMDGFSMQGNIFVRDTDIFLPVYEGKMIDQYDHRHAGIIHYSTRIRTGEPTLTTVEEHLNPNFFPAFRYWVSIDDVKDKLGNQDLSCFIIFKDITTASSERTFKASISSIAGIGNSSPIIQTDPKFEYSNHLNLIANFNSFVLDYIARQKIGYLHINFYILKQFPVLSPHQYNSVLSDYIGPRVLELSYTAWDIKPFADRIWKYVNPERREQFLLQHDQNQTITTHNNFFEKPSWLENLILGEISSKPFPKPPFIWNDERRFQIRCELDALFGHLYGLTQDEFDYILETFPIVKRKDEEKYGEYRTKKVILEEFEKMADDPMLEGVCVPYHERVSVLEHPEVEQPLLPQRKQTRPAPAREEMPEPAQEKTGGETITPKKQNKSLQTGPKSQLNFYEDLEKASDPKTDFSLYKCRGCRKLVMGFSIEEHTRDVHGGIMPGYERVK